jgi:hypothetical protein
MARVAHELEQAVALKQLHLLCLRDQGGPTGDLATRCRIAAVAVLGQTNTHGGTKAAAQALIWFAGKPFCHTMWSTLLSAVSLEGGRRPEFIGEALTMLLRLDRPRPLQSATLMEPLQALIAIINRPTAEVPRCLFHSAVLALQTLCDRFKESASECSQARSMFRGATQIPRQKTTTTLKKVDLFEAMLEHALVGQQCCAK